MKNDFIVESIKRIIAALLKKTGDRDRRDAIKWTIRLLEKCNTVSKEVECVISLCIDRGDHDLSKILTLLPNNEKKKWGEKAITRFIKEGWLKSAKETASVLERKLSDDELVVMAKTIVSDESRYEEEKVAKICRLITSDKKKVKFLKDTINSHIDEHAALSLAELLPAGNNEIIKRLLQRFLKKYPWLVWEAISLNVSLSERDAKTIWPLIRKNAIKGGDLEAALKAVECMKQALSEKELRDMLYACKKEGYYKKCISVSKLLGHEFSADDKKEIINHMLEKNELHEARKATSYLFSSKDDTEIKILFLMIISDRFIQKGFDTGLEDAFEIIKDIPSDKAAVIKKKIIEGWLKILEKGGYVYMPNIEKVVTSVME